MPTPYSMRLCTNIIYICMCVNINMLLFWKCAENVKSFENMTVHSSAYICTYTHTHIHMNAYSDIYTQDFELINFK